MLLRETRLKHAAAVVDDVAFPALIAVFLKNCSLCSPQSEVLVVVGPIVSEEGMVHGSIDDSSSACSRGFCCHHSDQIQPPPQLVRLL